MDHEEFRRIGHRVVDELNEYFATVGERPVPSLAGTTIEVEVPPDLFEEHP